jgi:tyrosyl-tRNA synthetase
VLARDHHCELQIGGSDQWGNITAGIDLCRKKLGKQVFGLTLPLITNADGSKFGKTEAGAIWLDPKRTSVYRFYQYWINTDDRDVIRYLKYFTFFSRDEIATLEKKHAENPGVREAHKALAKAATDLIHGPSATAAATSMVFPKARSTKSSAKFRRRKLKSRSSQALVCRSWNCSSTPACVHPKAKREKTLKAAASTSTTIAKPMQHVR